MPKVFAVILNWNNAKDTINCVNSLLSSDKIPEKIVVVDNGSTDDSEVVLKKNLPTKCSFIQTGQNKGYAGGMRVGADYCLDNGADLLWFLNNDTVILPNTLSELLASIDRNGLQYLYSPRILYLSHPDKVYFGGAYFNTETGIFDTTLKSGSPQYGVTKDDLISDVIQGASFIAPAKIVDELGFMDEDLFLYWEEFDYCFRLAQHGIKFICVLSAEMLHKKEGSPSSESFNLNKIRVYYRIRNRVIFWKRHLRENLKQYVKRELQQHIQWFVKRQGYKDPNIWVSLMGLWHGLIGKSGRVL
ncbi:MAG: glycosyltransferase family 2 protein [Crocosphaera sp.]|nr:glycosyltransferase family 2 protein [Crocosphaera sp.]